MFGKTKDAVKAATAALCLALSATSVYAAAIVVNSVDDDVFPDSAGTVAGMPGKCTLRMAIAAANLDEPVGGAGGCSAGAGADTITFDPALFTASARTITLASVVMSEAPATYAGTVATALVVSRPLTITGPSSTQLTIDGSVAGSDGRRMMTVSDGLDNTDFLFKMTGMRFYRGRAVDQSAGCMFSSESIELDDLTFESCESVGGASATGFGGALGAGSVLAATVAPNVTVSNSRFLNNRALRGSSATRADNGGAFFGAGTRKVGAVTLTNVLFNGNSADRQGAMMVNNAASVTISASKFVSNAATGTDVGGNGSGRYGAFVIQNTSGDVTINNRTVVIGNVANQERGGFGVLTVGGSVTIDNVDVIGNYVNREQIGGFEVLTDTITGTTCNAAQLRPVNISNIRIKGNSAATNTGGFRVTCSGALTMTDAEVVGNEARGYRLSLSDVVNSGNSAGTISAATDASAAQTTATLTRVVFRGNETNLETGGTGGFGIFTVNAIGAFTADNVRFTQNYAATGNAGLVLSARQASRAYTVINSEFSENSSAGVGPLLLDGDGAYVVRNSTVAANATGASPFMINANSNTPNGVSVAIENSTIARNFVTTGADAVAVVVFASRPNAGVLANTLFNGSNASVTFYNTVLAARSPGSATTVVGADAGQGVTNVTATNTLLERSAGAPASFCSGAGMKCDIGSLVSPIAFNGGFTRTMALQAGSPALNAGGAAAGGLTTDQRGTGFPRVAGAAADLGAFEASPATTFGCTLDVDGNGSLDALTDGLLAIRSMFGLTGTAATNGAVGSGASRNTWALIQKYLSDNCGTTFAP
jgi:CSLREA domain-containing protein